MVEPSAVEPSVAGPSVAGPSKAVVPIQTTLQPLVVSNAALAAVVP